MSEISPSLAQPPRAALEGRHTGSTGTQTPLPEKLFPLRNILGENLMGGVKLACGHYSECLLLFPLLIKIITYH